MGEIADMMLEGFLDEETGEVIDGDAPGYPRRMSDGDLGPRDTPSQRTAAQRKARSAKRARARARKRAAKKDKPDAR